MARVKRGVTTKAKHKRILESAKGYYGRRKNTIRIARQAVEKAGQYAYRDRKVKKRTFRGLDRKVLADIAMHEGDAFSAIIAQAKAALPQDGIAQAA
jgi:large subunit ribosomal protein L20